MPEPIGIDFETYFDDDYTLKKLTTEEYIRSNYFDPFGAAVLEQSDCTWESPVGLHERCEVWKRRQQAGEQFVFYAHHAHFDGLILSHHFDFFPDFWMDTLSMGRVCFDSGVKLGLEDLAARLGLQPKSVPYQKFKGYHWHQLSNEVQREVAEGACHDIRLTYAAMQRMITGGSPAVPYAFPNSELAVIDMTVKMFTEPCLVGDLALLGEAWTQENADRKELFTRLADVVGEPVTPELLRKDDQFARLLKYLGVEPETKITAKGNEKYAFAKSDYFMQDLATDEDPDIALLAEARLKAHSSIYLTRAERFGFIATRGPIPIYLAYSRAHTRRWGGGDKQNAQNLPRPNPAQPRKGALRRAIKAP